MNQEIGKIFIRAVSLSYFLLNQFDLGQCFLIVQNIQMFHLVIPPPATSWKPENRRWVNREVLNFLKTFNFWKKGCASENGDWIKKWKIWLNREKIMDAPEKKVVARAGHWRTLLQICHDFQGASGGIQLGTWTHGC